MRSYEELRRVIVDALLKPAVALQGIPISQWAELTSHVARTLYPPQHQPGVISQYSPPNLHHEDAELVRDIFWDLFRQGYITLGINNSNPTWPFFRLSYFGRETLGSDRPHRFHDVRSYVENLRSDVPDVSDEAIIYLEEAVSSFYAGCMLAASVMLGVAAEAEFIRLSEEAAIGSLNPHFFEPALQERSIRQRILKFTEALKKVQRDLEPRKRFEDLDTNLSQIQSVIRVARNDAGHPTAAPTPGREQVYVNLQLFVPLARQMMFLRQALK